MFRKHLRHFNRGLVIGFEIFGVLLLLLIAAWVALLARLSQGPLNVDFLTRSFERSLAAGSSGYTFDAGSTILTWGGTGQPLVFEMSHVQVARADKTPVLAVDKIGIQLSKRYLMFGQVVPRVVRIYTPALRIVRGEDGHITLNVSDTTPAPAPAPELIGPVKPAAPVDHTALVQAVLGQLAGDDGPGFLSRLRQVSIQDAALLYEDKQMGVSWRSKKSDLLIERARGGLDIDLLANIDLDAEHTATLKADAYINWRTRETRATLSFVNVNPAVLAQQSPALKSLAGVNLPVKGSVALAFDSAFKPQSGRFSFGADKGDLAVPGLYDKPIPVESFYVRGTLNGATAELTLEKLEADIGGPKVTAMGAIAQKPEGHAINLSAAITDMPIDKLTLYWPEALTPQPRAWVTGHLSGGIATHATLELAMKATRDCAAGCALPWDGFAAPALEKVGGTIDFKGIKVDYFPPLMPVLKVAGKATYDHKSFNLDLTTGALGDMQVTGSKIAITDLDIQNETIHSKIDISVGLKGPLKTALGVLDSKPLQYPKQLGLTTADVGGGAEVDVNFKFPLHEALHLEEVKVEAKAKLNDVRLTGLVGSLPLTGGPLDLRLKDSALSVKGKAQLAAMPLTFDWTKNFATPKKGKSVTSTVTAALPLDAPALASFGVPAELKMSGTIPADVTYTAYSDATAALVFKGDITPAGFTIPVANYEKKAGEAGTLGMTVQFRDDRLAGIDGLALSAGAAQLQGGLTFASDGKSFKTAQFSRVKLGGTDVAFTLDTRGSEGYDIKVNGAQLDAAQMFDDPDAPPAPRSTANAEMTTPLAVTLAVDRLVTGKERDINNTRIFMRRNAWSRIEQLEVDGLSGGKPIVVRYLPVPKGHTLQFRAENAGAALSALGVSNAIRGGRIVVSGQPSLRDPGKRNLIGTVVLSDFTAVKVPVLGRLLNALSLSGIIELLNGKGIAFKKMRADFAWIDKGPPDSDKNVQMIVLKDGQTSGASLGLTFEGTIDNWSNTLDMSGTIIPVSDLNKLASSIPLVGDILTGGGNAVFAATYKVKGGTADPSVSVNPLSVLAPGFVRKLFFEK